VVVVTDVTDVLWLNGARYGLKWHTSFQMT